MTNSVDGSDATLIEILDPALTIEQLERVERYAIVESVAAGNIVMTEGVAHYDFLVLKSGELSVLLRDVVNGTELVMATHVAGRFLGEMSMLTGQKTAYAARCDTDSVLLRLPVASFRRFMAAEPDIIFATFMARREQLQKADGRRSLRIVGSRYSARSMELRSFVRRQRIPHEWTDLDNDNADVDALLESIGVRRIDTPVVVTPQTLLRNPTVGQLAQHLGLSFTETRGKIYDLTVIGAGPGGLAAGVYGASEGLSTLVLDGGSVGGQAGTSSRIENYFGFPAGISGGDLVESGAAQAARLGADINSPCVVVGVRHAEHGFVLEIGDGAEVLTRCVLVATGVQYRKLALVDLDRFEQAGVYYAATDLEARVCAGEPVVVIGGGNSAGQAAVYLAQRGCAVTVVIRGDDLAASMSTYLIDRIDASPDITVLARSEVTALHGIDHLDCVDLTTRQGDATTVRTVRCSGVFSFIGAAPCTKWLRGVVDLDSHGFVLTDCDVVRSDLTTEVLAFESSQPGIFAAGDVRHGSMKRVAAAVGEGSSAVRSVHDYLARHRSSAGAI
jgi:thioredoxin reductase (NADPH)